jgi:hypothetical protein
LAAVKFSKITFCARGRNPCRSEGVERMRIKWHTSYRPPLRSQMLRRRPRKSCFSLLRVLDVLCVKKNISRKAAKKAPMNERAIRPRA